MRERALISFARYLASIISVWEEIPDILVKLFIEIQNDAA